MKTQTVSDEMIERELSNILIEEYKNEPENREHRTVSALYHRFKGATWYRDHFPSPNDKAVIAKQAEIIEIQENNFNPSMSLEDFNNIKQLESELKALTSNK